MSRLVDLMAEARRIAALLADPGVAGAQREALGALADEVRAAMVEASIDDQRRALLARADAAREAAAETVRVHPASHVGRCPPPGDMWVTRAEVEAHGSGAVWHVDVDVVTPSWWPKTGRIDSTSPAELGAARAAREVELVEAAEADRASSRTVLGIAPG